MKVTSDVEKTIYLGGEFANLRLSYAILLQSTNLPASKRPYTTSELN